MKYYVWHVHHKVPISLYVYFSSQIGPNKMFLKLKNATSINFNNVKYKIFHTFITSGLLLTNQHTFVHIWTYRMYDYV